MPDGFRKQGLGRQLVRALLRHAGNRRGTQLVQLTVTEGNAPARRLYEASGFVPFGVELFAVRVGANCVSKVHMWCDLSLRAGNDAAQPEH